MSDKNKSKSAQISFEFLILMGFLAFVIISILGVALFYSASTKDRIKMVQVNNFGNKIVSTCESVFYAGEPSKATITAYLPEGVSDITINEDEDMIVLTVLTQSGTSVIGFSSKVPITDGGTELDSNSGLRRIVITAGADAVSIVED